jgi:hypothetical protein
MCERWTRTAKEKGKRWGDWTLIGRLPLFNHSPAVLSVGALDTSSLHLAGIL